MFEQFPLRYPLNALEPYISAEIMRLHYEKHHRAYINNLNSALLKYNYNFSFETIYQLIKEFPLLPDDIRAIVRNNLGGHLNHTVFWNIMSPVKTTFSQDFLQKIIADFGSEENMWELFTAKALSLFGSGWVWVVYNSLQNKLEINQYYNQEYPLFENKIPLCGIDVWEHAYYLDYKNERAKYIEAWKNVVNKSYVSQLYQAAIA